MKYVVYGLGISGLSTAKSLAKNGVEIIATDDNEKAIANAQAANHDGILFSSANNIKYDADTVISFAPGIPLYFPQPHNILEICQNSGADLACDIEIFYRLNRQNNFIAITGTNGKSTTTALTGFIFKDLNIVSEIGGNIGVPCFDLPVNNTQPTTYIFETSSYQLDLLSQTHFRIAALLNITPDHIDRHGSLNNYIAAKKRIFRNQAENDFALIDVDNENSRQLFDELKNDKNFRATLVPISTKRICDNGLALFDGKLVNKIGGTASEFALKSTFLRGEHNDQNMAFAFAISFCHALQHSLKISEKAIISAITKFKGLRHRLQLLGEIDGIKFINDSKATNAESSENALKAYDNIFWILGGKPKDGGISILTPYFKKVAKAYLIGEASEEFAAVLEKHAVEFVKCGDLKNAIAKSFADAQADTRKEKNILLSPACASFDQWKNFEERGDFFCKTFDELQNS